MQRRYYDYDPNLRFAKRFPRNDSNTVVASDVHQYTKRNGQIGALKVMHVNSLTELQDVCLEAQRRFRAGVWSQTSAARACVEYFGSSHYKRNAETITSGNSETAAKVRDRLKELDAAGFRNTIQQRRRKTRNSQGAELDIHSMRMGNLDRCWLDSERVNSNLKGQSKNLHLVVSLTAAGHHSHTAYEWKTAAMYKLCQIAAQHGISTKITFTDSVYVSRARQSWHADSSTCTITGIEGNVDYLFMIQGKGFSERFDIERVVNIVNPHVAREIIFPLENDGPYRGRNLGRGRPLAYSNEKRYNRESNGAYVAIRTYIDKYHKDSKVLYVDFEPTKEGCIAWLTKQLIGIKNGNRR